MDIWGDIEDGRRRIEATIRESPLTKRRSTCDWFARKNFAQKKALEWLRNCKKRQCKFEFNARIKCSPIDGYANDNVA